MRTLAPILLVLTVLPADAQTSGKERVNPFGLIDYKACEAKPRWLLVTVVEQEVRIQTDEGDWKRMDEISGPVEESMLIDRCEISSIDEAGPNRKGSTRIYQSRRGSFVVYSIEESLQDICRVLPDCADVTNSEERP